MSDISAVLRKVAPGANALFVAASRDAGAVMTRYGITSAAAQAQVIAHCAHETQGFKKFEENLSYSAARLMQVWPQRFPTQATAAPYAKNPKALAIKVYGGRMGNRPGTEDGWDCRGSGALHHTGRGEFQRVQRRTGIDVVAAPEKLRDPAAAHTMWHAACSYFVDRGALAAAERGDTVATTRLVNGGLIGLGDRQIMVARTSAALAGVALASTGKTTAESSEAARKRAQKGTVLAPAGGGTSGTGTGTQTDMSTAIMVGLGITVVLVLFVVVPLWRRASAAKAKLDALTLATIKQRAETAPEGTS